MIVRVEKFDKFEKSDSIEISRGKKLKRKEGTKIEENLGLNLKISINTRKDNFNSGIRKDKEAENEENRETGGIKFPFPLPFGRPITYSSSNSFTSAISQFPIHSVRSFIPGYRAGL